MRTVLIHHAGAEIEERVLTGWLAALGELAGTIVIHEPSRRLGARVRRELKRVGPLRFTDVLAFRLYYRLRLAAADRAWERAAVAEAASRGLGPPQPPPPRLDTTDPNGTEAVAFLRELQPDLVLARCRTLLSEEVFSVPAKGTFVTHPGIAPEYRNSHGCFWALANRDLDRVGLTLLRIDAGVDTGPVYGYYTYAFDERHESHVVIQKRMLLENLEPIGDKLLDIDRGAARPIDTTGRESGAWGQPWMSAYARWKRKARHGT